LHFETRPLQNTIRISDLQIEPVPVYVQLYSIACLVQAVSKMKFQLRIHNIDTKQKIKILLVDDYAPIRKSLRILLTSVLGVEVIGEAEDGRIKGCGSVEITSAIKTVAEGKDHRGGNHAQTK